MEFFEIKFSVRSTVMFQQDANVNFSGGQEVVTSGFLSIRFTLEIKIALPPQSVFKESQGSSTELQILVCRVFTLHSFIFCCISCHLVTKHQKRREKNRDINEKLGCIL